MAVSQSVSRSRTRSLCYLIVPRIMNVNLTFVDFYICISVAHNPYCTADVALSLAELWLPRPTCHALYRILVLCTQPKSNEATGRSSRARRKRGWRLERRCSRFPIRMVPRRTWRAGGFHRLLAFLVLGSSLFFFAQPHSMIPLPKRSRAPVPPCRVSPPGAPMGDSVCGAAPLLRP